MVRRRRQTNRQGRPPFKGGRPFFIMNASLLNYDSEVVDVFYQVVVAP
jgi:hypothetical protein